LSLEVSAPGRRSRVLEPQLKIKALSFRPT
jgi:hypothetical protein